MHEGIDDGSMSCMFNFKGIFQDMKNRFHHSSFSQKDFLYPGHEFVLHGFLDACNQL
jgi:hypothetical protein